MCLHAWWPDLVGMGSDELQEEGESPEKVKIPGKQLWTEWSWVEYFICRPGYQQ